MPRTLSEAELARHERQLADNGYTLIDRLLDDAETDAVLAAMQPLHVAQDYGANDFTGFRTRGAAHDARSAN